MKLDEFQRDRQRDIEKITKSLNIENEKFGQEVEKEIRLLKGNVNMDLAMKFEMIIE